ncbi:TPA: replication protein [Pseudomonas aeruginosa]|uniref:replication protein n=1 Tax=Pseudomonas aeruginosa TaxID=287 RepID=UPI0029288159|nr:replication protein [Pseudomonas aeruginosa]HEB4079338.1 replication protein [Pseudomonas aeruginosa]
MSNIVSLRNTGGFTRMDNDLYEALIRAELSGRELRVALAIHRLTVGYNVEEARIAASVIADMSGIHREDVSRAICELIRQRVIYRTGGSRSPMGFAPVSEWKIDGKNTHQNKQKSVPQCGVSTTSNVAFLPHNKDSKDNLVPSELVAAAAPTTPELVLEPAPQPDQPEPKAQPSDRIPYEKIRDLYNQILGGKLKRCMGVTEAHRKHIRAAYNLKLDGGFPVRDGGLSFWEGLFNDVLDCPFMLGNNNRGWRADFEFLTTASKIQRFMEGKYDAA